MRKIILGLVLSYSLFSGEDSEKVFSDIYKHHGWGTNDEGIGFSGPGSTLSNTVEYIAFLEDFMRKNQIKTVVEAGCGDWTFSQKIAWGDIHYLGVDVVKSVIDRNVQQYASENIRFECLDILKLELPCADLLLCKDVLMHLSNEDIALFLKSTKKFKHCLFTNNLGSENENSDIERGEYRSLDLTKAPFCLNGIKIFTYSTDHTQKQVLYYGN